jgi:prepilin-type N-terminal cleavage/methylation domain-containing protein
MLNINKNNQAFSLVEIIVAVAVFAMLAAGVFYVATNSYSNYYGSGDKQVVSDYGQEGIEAVKSIKENSWQDIVDNVGSATGLYKDTDGSWIFSGESDAQGGLSRSVTISSVQRDNDWNIVESGGTDDPSTKKIQVEIFDKDKVEIYELATYITDWNSKTWQQTDWSGVGDSEFWASATIASSSHSNVSTSTSGQLKLTQAASGTAFSWSAWSDLTIDSAAKYKAWEDFYNYELSPDGNSVYIIGTTNYDFTKYDISRAQAGIMSPEFKITVPWHTQNVVLNPNGEYVYIAKRIPSDGTDNVCVVELAALIVDTDDCYDVTYAGAYSYYHDMLVNAAGTKLYVFDRWGYGYTFTISDGGATLTLTNDRQLLASSAGTSYSINGAYLDESGAEPYVHLVLDDPSGEFRKLGFDGDYFSSTSTDAYVDSSFTADLTDIEFLETSSGKNRFILGTEISTKEFIIVEDQGSSLTEVGNYNLSTSQSYAEVTHDGEDMAFVHYYSPAGLYAIDISDRENPADGSLSNTSMNRKSNYTTFDQIKFSTTTGGMILGEHRPDDASAPDDDRTALYYIGRGMTRATGGQYTYKRTITLGENSKVSGGPHTDFPVAIAESDDYLKSASNGGKVQSEYGYDIIFTSDSDGETVLSHEIEEYSASTGKFTAWVKIPSLANDTDIYMFYGNSDIVSTQENISDVWSNDYQFVQHMTDSGIAGTRSSVHSSNGGFKYAEDSPSEVIEGKIGRSQSFDGSYDYLTIENNVDKEQRTSDFTVEAWMKPSSSGTTYSALYYFGNGDVADADGFVIRHHAQSTDKLQFHMGDNNVTNLGGLYFRDTAISDDVWTYVVMVVDRDVGYQGYVNNTAGNSYSIDSSAYSIGEVYDVNLGKDWSSSDYFFQGELDEMRISTTTRSTDWLTTGYNNMNATSTFYSMGSESVASGYASPGSIYSSIYDIGSADQDLRSITIDQNVPSGCGLQITLEAADNAAMSNAASQVFDDVSVSSYTSSTPVALDGKRYLRYKAYMTSCNTGADSPTLYSVKLDYR